MTGLGTSRTPGRAPAPLRALLVDDEPLARELLRSMLEVYADVEVVGECGDGAAAVRAVLELEPDVLFLDVQMPERDGFEVLAAVSERLGGRRGAVGGPPGLVELPAVVFVTAYDQFALRAFDVHALDYLLKPFDEERLDRALQRVRERARRGERGAGTASGWSSAWESARSSSRCARSSGWRRRGRT